MDMSKWCSRCRTRRSAQEKKGVEASSLIVCSGPILKPGGRGKTQCTECRQVTKSCSLSKRAEPDQIAESLAQIEILPGDVELAFLTRTRVRRMNKEITMRIFKAVLERYGDSARRQKFLDRGKLLPNCTAVELQAEIFDIVDGVTVRPNATFHGRAEKEGWSSQTGTASTIPSPTGAAKISGEIMSSLPDMPSVQFARDRGPGEATIRIPSSSGPATAVGEINPSLSDRITEPSLAPGDSRGLGQTTSIIPTSTGAAKAVGAVTSSLNDKFAGMSLSRDQYNAIDFGACHKRGAPNSKDPLNEKSSAFLINNQQHDVTAHAQKIPSIVNPGSSRATFADLKCNISGSLEKVMIDLTALEMGEMLGAGGYKEVHKAVYRGKQVAACKFRGKIVEEDIQEILLLSQMSHPNIIGFVGFHPDLPGREPILLLELALNNLAKYMRAPEIPRPTTTARIRYMQDVAAGIVYLHKHAVIHRDIKSTNILVCEGGLKLADFGSTRVRSSVQEWATTDAGTLGWQAPEIVQGKPYSHKVDVYCCGILFYIMILWSDCVEDQDVRFEDGERPAISRFTSEWGSVLVAAIRKMWSMSPDKRPEMDEVVSALEHSHHSVL
ncbi:kinase-like protein [Calocera cornea HHB12733]|uniref:Kinase-like protein n=1 Tax=Calocera cornea HHB12733 TaxID=1353952 RepID=A0A165GKR8_9BASI|nr:kinase-like protein [Calocera cornea HHB12733]